MAGTPSSLIRATALALLLAAGNASAGLLGTTFDGDFGINNSGGPFDPGFFEQIDGGIQVVGAGVEFTSFFGPNIDFTDTQVIFTGFNSGHALLPFNGWRFVLQSPGTQITNVTIASTTVPGLDATNIFFTSSGFAVNAEASMLGNLTLNVTTTAVPEPGTLLLLLPLLAVFGAARKLTTA